MLEGFASGGSARLCEQRAEKKEESCVEHTEKREALRGLREALPEVARGCKRLKERLSEGCERLREAQAKTLREEAMRDFSFAWDKILSSRPRETSVKPLRYLLKQRRHLRNLASPLKDDLVAAKAKKKQESCVEHTENLLFLLFEEQT
ncbi:hypothetical protein AMTR_s00031p00186750 [Amborella trichopoda]|uniref:Uncharacterized protein n=1 Tax=Amborella trichopoda TaxID=13333 RepID=U5CTJ1_AMBTC|nr:hypothetical protein AMTR_s00031p00186750 [Amborella trichopoda]